MELNLLWVFVLAILFLFSPTRKAISFVVIGLPLLLLGLLLASEPDLD